MKVISLMLREGQLRIAALAALVGLAAAALLAIAPAAADGHPSDVELVISLVDEADNIVPPDSEFTVEAALRFTDPFLNLDRWLNVGATGSWLRLSNYLEWEGQALNKLDIAAQHVIGREDLPRGVDADGNNLPGHLELIARALDGRTLVARTGQGNYVVIYDVWNKRQVAVFEPPAGAAPNSFGQSAAQRREGKAIAVWHDDRNDKAWMFIGSNQDTVEGRSSTGQLYVYELDWSVDPLGVTLAATLAPPSSEFMNSLVNDSNYGLGVVVSQDGSTLAVSASSMNAMGAVYVYTRPDGEGEDWGDLEYADGIKVTAAAVPAWGAATTRPFTPTSTGRTGAAGDCDAYCSRVTSLTGVDGGVTNRSNFGWWGIDLSADGSVLAVGAPGKRYSFSTPGGQFTGGTAENGEAYVFVAPNGGWQTTPEVTGTLLPAGTSATHFDPALHYSPGPMRRVTEPTAVLLGRSWASPAGQALGREVGISDDGSIVAVSAHIVPRVMIFQRDSADAWADAGDLLPTATLVVAGSQPILSGGMALRGDGGELLVGELLYGPPHWHSGRVLAYSRPADGQWAGTVAVADARIIQSPTPRGGGRFAHPRYDLRGERLVATESAQPPGAGGVIWVSDGGCTQRAGVEESIWTCPITLNDPTVVVPPGSEDGPFTISGRATLSVQGVADSSIELSGRLDLEIGTVREVDTVSLGLATDASSGQPYPSLIEKGEKTRLRLQILNENGMSAAKGSISSVVVTTTLGGLSSLVKDGACGGGDGRLNCVIPTSALTGLNAGELLLELSHTDVAGTATVSATVLGAQGERLSSNQVTVDIAGPPAALTITQPSSAVLGYDPGDPTDQRNRTTLVVSATDKDGGRASVPSRFYRAKLTDSAGKRLDRGDNPKAAVAWPLRVGDASDGALLLSGGNPQARVTILAGASAPLAAGEYTLELIAGSLTETQTITVAGGATALTLSVDPPGGSVGSSVGGSVVVGGMVTVTAMVTDASGAPVPDGTPVNFNEGSTDVGVVLVLLSPARQLTNGGQASVTAQAVALGNAYVRATADGVAGLQTIRVVTPPRPPLVEMLTSTTPDTTTIWTGTWSTTASQLYPALEGVSQLSVWDGYEWISYGVTRGILIPGSDDFPISRGTVLWLGGE